MAMVIKRWSTTPAINRQDVAQHSFYVVLYTDFITQMLKWPHARCYAALHWAVIHDIPETVISDMPGPVKRIVTNKKALEATEERIFVEFGDGYTHDISDWQVRAVVKAANLIDEVFYLHSEKLLGNQYLDRVFANSWSRLHKALKKINLTMLMDVVKHELDDMGHGVVGLINDDDLEEGEHG